MRLSVPAAACHGGELGHSPARHVFRGKFQGATLTLICHSAMGHHRLVYDLSEKGTLRSTMEMSSDGKQRSAMFEGVYHRQKA